MSHPEIETFLAENNITVEATFVPFSQSRNAKPNATTKDMSLNWKVKVLIDGMEVVETDYMAGIGHLPLNKQNVFSKMTIGKADAIKHECETGRSCVDGTIIMPDQLDVLYSLVGDAEAIDHATFEEWADSYGYDNDSRKAEQIYRACLELGLKMRNGLGNDRLKRLQELFQDY